MNAVQTILSPKRPAHNNLGTLPAGAYSRTVDAQAPGLFWACLNRLTSSPSIRAVYASNAAATSNTGTDPTVVMRMVSRASVSARSYRWA